MREVREMKCRTLSVRLEQPFAAIDETTASEFLDSVTISEVNASLTNTGEPSWSILVLYEEAPERDVAPRETPVEGLEGPVPRTPGHQGEIPAGPDEARLLESLKAWRALRATSDGLPQYCVAQNRSLEQIARTRPGTAQELLQVTGFGPVRVEKYGHDIIAVVVGSNGRGRKRR
jgi:superfamily II DNA helicase RecQ